MNMNNLNKLNNLNSLHGRHWILLLLNLLLQGVLGSSAGVSSTSFVSSHRWDEEEEETPLQQQQQHPQPFFGRSSTNRTLLSGQTAFLNCRVHMLGYRSVTWMRVRDLHILTVGHITYTADERVKVLHNSDDDDWTLQIRYSQPSDSGLYKCQVNSDLKLVRKFYLKVTDKSDFKGQLYKMPSTDTRYDGYDTRITGPSEKYVELGRTLTMECVVTYIRRPPSSVFWYHHKSRIDYDSPRKGISVKMEKTDDQTVSTLLIYSVTSDDTGNYTCLPTNAPSASALVYVNDGKTRLAMQQKESETSSAVSTNKISAALQCLLVILLVTLSPVTSAAVASLSTKPTITITTPTPIVARFSSATSFRL